MINEVKEKANNDFELRINAMKNMEILNISSEAVRHYLFNKYCANNDYCITCPLYKDTNATCLLVRMDDLIRELKATV